MSTSVFVAPREALRYTWERSGKVNYGRNPEGGVQRDTSLGPLWKGRWPERNVTLAQRAA